MSVLCARSGVFFLLLSKEKYGQRRTETKDTQKSALNFNGVGIFPTTNTNKCYTIQNNTMNKCDKITTPKKKKCNICFVSPDDDIMA